MRKVEWKRKSDQNYEAEFKLNQNESPFDFPREMKERVLARMAERPWNLYPDFESTALRTAVAKAYGFEPENILVGNGSNELLAAAIGAFVGPGTPVRPGLVNKFTKVERHGKP